MKYSNAFGKKSSKILLGTAYFGDGIGEKEAFELMDRFVSLGGCHIDTARLYADGISEKIVGKWLKERGSDGIFLSTKGAFPKKETPHIPRLSREEIRSDIEQSLDALKRDSVDFYWLHRDDEGRDAGEIIETMNELFREGRFSGFGASNWKHERVEKANLYAKEKGLKGFSASQIRFSPAILVPGGDSDRGLVDMEKGEFDYYKVKNMPVAAFASQAKGFFSKMASGGEDSLSQKAKDRYLCPENLKTFEIIKKLSKKYNTSIASIVCASLCAIEDVDVFPIIGPGRLSQLEDSLNFGAWELTKEEVSEIFERLEV